MGEEWDRGFAEGRRVGRIERQFAGWPRTRVLPGLRFTFRGSLFASYVAYEHDVVVNLRRVQQLRWLAQQEQRRFPGSERSRVEDGALAKGEAEVEAELQRIREAVDSELQLGHGKPTVVEALRAVPEVPPTVVEFACAAECVVADPRRRLRWLTARVDLTGADYGSGWSLEDALRRWETTAWRISWICEEGKFPSDDAFHSDAGEATAEVYAYELLRPPLDPAAGRVWVLGKLHTRAAVERALDFDRQAVAQRNSLVAAAASVARVSREEGWAAP